jgi:hypothetical protein
MKIIKLYYYVKLNENLFFIFFTNKINGNMALVHIYYE